jgi:hypothetical protein
VLVLDILCNLTFALVRVFHFILLWLASLDSIFTPYCSFDIGNLARFIYITFFLSLSIIYRMNVAGNLSMPSTTESNVP